MQPSSTFTRRQVLATAAGLGAAAFLGGCDVTARSATSSETLQIDFGKTAFFPLLKSKIGVGRALDSTQILDSLQYLDQIRPAVYDAELRFPDTTYPALTPYPFTRAANGSVTVSPTPNTFLTTFFGGLQRRGMEIMVQLEGAPYQFFPPGISPQRPHLFPMPDNVSGAGNVIGEWAKIYRDYPISWCMWNEPTHNLTGSANPKSIKQLLEIYEAYTGAIEPQGLFGMASFISTSEKTSSELGGKTYFQAALDELRTLLKAKPDLPFDYLTLNSYGEDLGKLWDGARNGLSTDFNTVPLVQAQSGVFLPGTWEKSGGTALEAAKSMTSLQLALQTPDLQTFTFSGWLPHLIDYSGGTALQLPLFNALKLYAQMPDRRSPVQGSLPIGIGAMASGDQYRSTVMVWNETTQPYSVDLQLSDLATGQNGTKVAVYHIDGQHGSPKEHSGNDFTPTEVVPLDGNAKTLTKSVTVAGPGIVYVQVGSASDPDLDRGGLSATLVRKHTYADRIAGANGTITVRGNAYGCFDAVRAIAYVGVQGNAGTGLVGAEYRDLPDTLPTAIWTDQLAGQTSPESLFGIRVDYLAGSGATKSVLWHGDIFTDKRTAPLPWGRGGPTADVLVQASELNARAGQGNLALPLANHAPPGWAAAGRQAIISFWLDSTGPGSQAKFLLG
jgi:hypothetical protein